MQCPCGKARENMAQSQNLILLNGVLQTSNNKQCIYYDKFGKMIKNVYVHRKCTEGNQLKFFNFFSFKIVCVLYYIKKYGTKDVSQW
jgi:hypothetical protein